MSAAFLGGLVALVVATPSLLALFWLFVVAAFRRPGISNARRCRWAFEDRY